jgi:hypothetical protein
VICAASDHTWAEAIRKGVKEDTVSVDNVSLFDDALAPMIRSNHSGKGMCATMRGIVVGGKTNFEASFWLHQVLAWQLADREVSSLFV